MTFIEQTGSGLPDDLPLLTRVVDENFPDDLPTLTEVVIDEAMGETADKLQPGIIQEIISTDTDTDTATSAQRVFSEEEMQQLLLQLGTHLETVFAKKLSLHLEQLQQLAIEQAVNEFKADLPELLRDALNARTEL